MKKGRKKRVGKKREEEEEEAGPIRCASAKCQAGV